MELSPRLRTVASLVYPNAGFADVGTDHAYLPVWLLQRGIISHAVVSDLRQKPLERARQTAARYGLTERMSFRLGDGLSCIRPEEAQVITIAGMGGETIAQILEVAPWLLEGGFHLLLQPMSALAELRQWLQPHGYRIEQELLCQDGGSRYTVLSVKPGEMSPLTPAEWWAGRQIQGKSDPLRRELLNDLILRAERALKGIRNSKRLSDAPRRSELEQVYQGLRQMKEEWDTWQR